ncbi:hypothetical protein VKT23_016391 [Stygiomarasmius scandens]|uniref:Uncharacterized protein n=1 Tax=Marasmiellus scandens TaxID=2682957 RepID=A0ABR1IXP5_9AGAR
MSIRFSVLPCPTLQIEQTFCREIVLEEGSTAVDLYDAVFNHLCSHWSPALIDGLKKDHLLSLYTIHPALCVERPSSSLPDRFINKNHEDNLKRIIANLPKTLSQSTQTILKDFDGDAQHTFRIDLVSHSNNWRPIQFAESPADAVHVHFIAFWKAAALCKRPLENSDVEDMHSKRPRAETSPSSVTVITTSSGETKRDNILNEVRQLREKIRAIKETSLEHYGNPAVYQYLPSLRTHSDIFANGEEEYFTFRGRECIAPIVERMNAHQQTSSRSSCVRLEACKGAGSSVILSALATLLQASEKFYVFYIPRPGRLLQSRKDWFETVSRALLVALSTHPDFDRMAEEIFSCTTIKSVLKFIRNLPQDTKRSLIFLFDDFDVLRSPGYPESGWKLKREKILAGTIQSILVIVDKGRAFHNLSDLEITGIWNFSLPPSYTAAEELYFWHDLERTNPDVFQLLQLPLLKSTFLHQTGRLPLFMGSLADTLKIELYAQGGRGCLDGSRSYAELVQLFHRCIGHSGCFTDASVEFSRFVSSVFFLGKNFSEEMNHVFLGLIAQGSPPSVLAMDLFPNKWFHSLPELPGNISQYQIPAGFLREMLANVLRTRNGTFGNHHHYLLSQDFLDSTEPLSHNPAVLGTVTEMRLSARIEVSGLVLKGWEGIHLSKPGTVHVLDIAKPPPSVSFKKGPIYFHSLAYNVPAINGMYLIKDDPVVHIFPIQMTIGKSHSDSELSFFGAWKSWIEHLVDECSPGCVINWNFIWFINGETKTGGQTLTSDGKPEPIDEDKESVCVVRPTYVRWVCGIDDLDKPMAQLFSN